MQGNLQNKSNISNRPGKQKVFSIQLKEKNIQIFVVYLVKLSAFLLQLLMLVTFSHFTIQ